MFYGSGMNITDISLLRVWPEELIKWEFEQIGDDKDALAHLLREAFHDPDGELVECFENACTTDPWWAKASTAKSPRAVFSELVTSPRVRQFQRRVYFAERKSQGIVQVRRKLEAEFILLLKELSSVGYFQSFFETLCVDGEEYDQSSSEQEILRKTGLRVRLDQLMAGEFPANDDVYLTLIEFFHDKVRRPRKAHMHPYADCGMDYSDHNVRAGRVVYRWRINEILNDVGSPYRLSGESLDEGFLVHTFDPSLDAVVIESVALLRDDQKSELTGAVQSYRRRGATRAERKAAVTTLANELERDRELVKQFLLTKGERDLFNIANNFAIRHRNDRQIDDYGDEFLDWIFHAILATLRLVHSQLPDTAEA